MIEKIRTKIYVDSHERREHSRETAQKKLIQFWLRLLVFAVVGGFTLASTFAPKAAAQFSLGWGDIPAQFGEVGVPITQLDLDAYVLTASGATIGSTPAWMSANGAVLSGTPTSAGTFTVQATAAAYDSELGNQIYPKTITWTITAPPPANPNFSWSPGVVSPSVYMNATLSIDLAAAGTYPDADTVTFAIDPATPLPAGVSFDGGSIIDGDPTIPGTYPITVNATDTGTQTVIPTNFTISVNVPSIDLSPWGNIPAQFGEVGIPITQLDLNAHLSGGSGAVVDSFPSWMSVNNGVLSGTPTSAGPFTVQASATVYDSELGNPTYPKTITWTITTPPPVNPNFSWSPGVVSPSVYVGAPLSIDLAAAGTYPDADTVTFAIDPATPLPAGVSFDGGSIIDGDPTIPGTYPITVNATDTGTQTVIPTNFTIVVNSVPPPNPNFYWDPGVVDPSVYVGAPLSIDLAAAGTYPDADTVTFAIDPATPLPAGVSFDGGSIIDGDPTTPGTYPITVNATDTGTQTVIPTNFTIVVNSAPLPPPVGIAASVTYQYDALGRLTLARYDDTDWLTYCYDANGNRTRVEAGLGGNALDCATVEVEPPVTESPPPSGGVVGTTDADEWTDADGAQTYDGLAGIDRLILAGVEADYSFSTAADGAGNITHADSETDTVRNVELLRFGGDGAEYNTYRYFGVTNGTDAAEVIIGSTAADTIDGLAGIDVITPKAGNDWIDGGAGADQVNLDGQESDYEFDQYADGPFRVTNIGTGEIDTLVSVQKVWFFGEKANYQLANIVDSNIALNAPAKPGSPPPNQPWDWNEAIDVPGAEQGGVYSIELEDYGTEPEDDSVVFTAAPLPAGLSLTGSIVSGSPTDIGTVTVLVTAADTQSGIVTDTSFDIVVTAAPSGGGLPAATLTIFDDALEVNTLEMEDGTSEVDLSSGSDPVYEGSTSLKVTGGSWAQGGVDRAISVDAANNILRFRVYRPDVAHSGTFMLRHGSSWLEAALDDSSHANWRLNGQTGQGDLGQMAINTWHLVEIDLTAMGITEVKALAVMGNATGGDIYFLDQIETTDQFSTGGGGGGGGGDPSPTDGPWIWYANINPDDAVEDVEYTLDLSGLGTEPDDESVTFSATSLPAWLSLSGDTLTGTPTEAGTFSVTVSGDDAGPANAVETSFDIVVTAAPSGGGLPAATLTIFDDALEVNTLEMEDGTSEVDLSSGSDPVYEGSTSLKVTGGSWAQGGVDRAISVDAANNILRFRVYRPDVAHSGTFMLRHGSSWLEAALDDSSHANWRLNGQTGQGDLGQMAINTWHLVEIDLTAMGITEVKALAVMGNATGGDIYFLDQIETTDQFSTGGSN